MTGSSHSHWLLLESLFHRAAELEAAERAVFLDREASDPELRRELENLLRCDAEAPDPVADAIEHLANIQLPAAGNELLSIEHGAAVHLGPYRLIEKIGQGGLGSVFLAERDDGQFERRVAVKVVRRDLVSARLLEDLRLERQILARLEHPHIARLYDGGTGPGERPYLAMEYVNGEPIDLYGDRLGLEARLSLFLQIAAAVSYAHANLVIHRDLKPSNILVTDEGVAKLLDFGIARPLAERGLAESAGLPRRRFFTPEFASPEQIIGEPLGTATDIYSLGVLLYRLLAGRLPYSMPRHADPKSWARQRSELPLPPAAQVAATEGLAWARRLRGDLEAILSKALAPSPEHRYASVRELSDDLQRYQEHRPISARAGTKPYLIARFLRRHRLAASAISAVLVALCSGLLATSWSLRRAEEARARAEGHLEDLSREQDRSGRLIESFVDTFRLADPGYAGGESSISVQELIDRRAQGLLAPEPAEFELLPYFTATFAEIYLNVSSPEAAEQLLKAGIGPADSQLEDDHFILWRHRDLLAESMIDQGNVDAAAARLESDMRRHRMEVGHEGDTLARLVHMLGVTKLHQEEAEAAARLFRQALYLYLNDGNGDSIESTESRHRLAQALVRSGDLDLAENELRSVLDYRRAILGEANPAYLTALGDLAAVALFRDDNQLAAELLRGVLDGQRSIFGPHHPHVAAALQNLAVAERRLGNRAAARQYQLESVAVRREVHGEEHPAVADALYGLARFYHQGGELDAAEPIYQQALEIRRQVLGEEHPAVAMALFGLADLEWSQGRSKRAATLYLDVIDRLEKSGRGETVDATYAYFQLGSALLREGQEAQAELWLQRAYEARIRLLGEEHSATQAAAAKLAELSS